MKKEKYEQLKSYILTKYDYHANLGKFNLGEREGLESEYKWRLLCDLVEYMDQLELYEDIDQQFKKKDNVIQLINS